MEMSYFQYLADAFDVAGRRVFEESEQQLTDGPAQHAESNVLLFVVHVDEEFAHEQGEASQILGVALHRRFALLVYQPTPFWNRLEFKKNNNNMDFSQSFISFHLLKSVERKSGGFG